LVGREGRRLKGTQVGENGGVSWIMREKWKGREWKGKGRE